jgi:lysophospholipase L1-like esterase
MISSQRGRRFLTKLPLILFGFFVGLIIAEVALRSIDYSYPEFYQLDQARGYSLRPGVEGWYRKEGGSYVRINSDGLRDREHTKTKPSNTIRVAVIGDSYTEALQVPMEAAFWSIMENRLQSCAAVTGKTVEVINFGVSGYGTAQELITLRERVWAYSPDIVLLAVTTNNDITDNSRALKKTDEVPYFVYRDGRLVADDSFKSSRDFLWRQGRLAALGRWLKDHLRLVQAINQAHRGFKNLLSSWRTKENPGVVTGPVDKKADPGLLADSSELGIDNFVYFEPTTSMWDDAWRVTEGLIVMMRDEVRSKGSNFVVATLSNRAQVLPKPEMTEKFMKQYGITDLFYPDKRIKSLCEREGIPVITLAPELQSHAERSQIFLHGFGATLSFGHWNADGHRVAGELLAQKLCQEVLPK